MATTHRQGRVRASLIMDKKTNLCLLTQASGICQKMARAHDRHAQSKEIA